MKKKLEKKDLEDLVNAAAGSLRAVVVELVRTKQEKESAKLLGVIVGEMKKIIFVAENYVDSGTTH